MPASRMAPIPASRSPRLRCEMAPMGKMWTAARRAVWTMNWVTAALSLTGSVLGMAQMEVKPPAAAARAPVSMVSACSLPGSRKCTCRSTKPGATTSPVVSSTSASGTSSAGATSAMSPSRTSTSRTASSFCAGSTTRPFFSNSIFCIPALPGVYCGTATGASGGPSSRSSTAIRTATPFSTWFRMTDREKSATSEEISRPRLMGPGCITIASSRASRR